MYVSAVRVAVSDIPCWIGNHNVDTVYVGPS